MAGQGKTLAALGGVLVAGIAAAVWLVMGAASDPAAPGATTVTKPETVADEAKPGRPVVAAGNRRPKHTGDAAVIGLIKRSKGKAPVADQEVQLVPAKGDPWSVKTDARGSFKMTELPHGEAFELRVTAAGCGTIHIPGIALDRNETRDVGTLWLDPSVRITVEVHAWSDVPVAGAVVEAFATVQSDNFDWSKAYAQMAQAPVAVGKAITDAAGKAIFPELATGRWTFTATKDGFARSGRAGITVRSGVEPPPVKLYLGTGHPLAGRVLDAAKTPVAGAQVMTGPPNTQWDLGSAALRSRTTTDAQGHYEFAALDAGDTVLLVGRPGGGIPSAVATVRIPYVAQFDVVLKGTANVAGVVTEREGGKPIDGATVRAWSWTGTGQEVGEATTDAQGKYALTVVAGSVGSIAAEKEGWVTADEPGRQQPPLQVREGETRSRDLKMRPGSKLSGVVKGPDGPLAGAKVYVQTGSPNTGWGQKAASTDSDGKYEVSGLLPGQALVRADFAGYYVKDFPDNYWMVMQQSGPSPFKVDIPDGGAATKDVEMVRGVTVEGRVDGPDGPLADVRVAQPQDFDGGVVTGADGAFRIEGVKPSATSYLYPTREGYAPTAANKPIVVTAEGPNTGIVLKMTRVGVVKGTVTTSDGSALKDAQVRINAWQDQNGMDQRMMMERGAFGLNQGAAAPVKPDGTYEIPLGAIASGKFTVSVTALDHPAVTSDAQPIVEGQSEYTVNLTVDGGKTLEGKVAVKQGGAPVAGAMVSVQSRGMSRGSLTVVNAVMSTGGGDGGQTVWAVTDAEGKFTVAHLAASNYAISARADGYIQGGTQVDLTTTTQVTVEIEPELAIEGVVILSDGSPVEGAQIQAQRDTTGTPTDKMQAFGGGGGGNAWGMSGSGGRFRLTGLASGNYRLTVSPDWQGEVNIRTKRTDPIAAGIADAKIVVETGGIIAGHVYDPQKKGLSNCWIYANPEAKDGKQAEGADSRNVRTKDDGSFSVVGLSDVTTYSLQIQMNQGGWDMSGGSTLKNTTVKGVAVGTKGIEVVLEEGLTITGVLVDADNKPVGNAYLQCQLTSRDGKGSQQNRNAMTDGNGAFTIGGLDGGDCSISIMEWGGPGANLIIENGDKVPAGTKDLRLVASKGLTITGTLVDESGTALKSGGVGATPKTGGRSRNAQAKDDGTFELTGLAAGASYKLTANSPGRPMAKMDDVAADTKGVRIALAKGADSSGRVVDDAGGAVKMARIGLRLTTDSDQQQRTMTDADGNFKAVGLVDGGIYEVTVSIRTQTTNSTRKCGTLKGGDTGVTLTAAPAEK